MKLDTINPYQLSLLFFFSLFLPLFTYANIETVNDIPVIFKQKPNINSAAVLPPKKQELIIGILSQTPQDSIANSSWQFTFSRLNTHQYYHFTAQFLTIEQLQLALDNDQLDFVICDAINYLKLKQRYGLLSLLTRAQFYAGHLISSEGLSIYSSDTNANITRLQDLKNKKIGVVDTDSSLSWVFLEKFLFNHELINQTNIQLERIKTLEDSLLLLASNNIDVIITKSGLIEQQLTLEQQQTLRLLNPRHGWQAPFLHSSVLIPEWSFAKSWFIDNELANQLVILLLTPPPNNENTLEQNNDTQTSDFFLTQYYWYISQNYNALNALFFPHQSIPETQKISSGSLSQKTQYWLSFITICCLFIILIMYLRSSKDLNNRLIYSKESLEQEIKERQHAQEQALKHQAELAHVARLSTMGEMASGLAHELNQPLSAIHTYVQGCIRRINMGNDDPETIINALKLTAQQADRAGGIIRRLRSFVRKGESHKTYSEINHIVNEVTGFLESQLKNKQITLTLDLEDDLPPVLADIIQIEQVLINLLKNGIESMANSEKPVIRVSTRRSDQHFIELCVIDRGHGISEDKLKRIFNPFFTTKTSGMGMGLSISSSIIEAHDGKLYAENNTEQGARFCLTLPITEE
jgi:two-component system sensor histidine kinase TtrS